MRMINYKFPKSFPRAEDIEVRINGEKADVLKTNVAYFVTAAYEEKIEVEITTKKDISSIQISPFKYGIKPEVQGKKAFFSLTESLYLYIELGDVVMPLFFYGHKLPEENVEATYFFRAGQTYEVGELVLRDNESLYIEGGAVVKGCIRAKNASNIKIGGHGVFDGSYYIDEPLGRRTILTEFCTDVEIKDITIINPLSWMVMLAGCQRVKVSGIKEIGEVTSSDGVDVVSSSDVTVEHCIIYNNDDGVVIKAFEREEGAGEDAWGWNRPVRNVLVQGCIFVAAQNGHCMEIGHELETEEVSNIRFYDNDVVCINGNSAAFAIHAGDRATVRDVVFEKIRIQHYYAKLIEFRISPSMWNKDKKRGQIRNVLLKDIEVIMSQYNAGYSLSIIGGYDSEHTVENITFENFLLGDKKVMSEDDIELYTKNTKNIIFK
jgi:hypothetical protein